MANPPKILFVHGAAADARVWTPIIAALPAEWQTEAITLSYFGEAEWPDDGSRFGPRLHAMEVAALADAMGGDVHLVCWSYAVHVGLQALLDAPARFASALFYEAGLAQYVSDPDDRATYGKDAHSMYGAVGAVMQKEGPEAAVRQLVGRSFATLAQDRQAMYLSNAPMLSLLMGGGEPPTEIGPDKLATIKTRCCVAMGANTRPAFSIPSKALAQHLPNATLDIVAGADHFMPETNPALFAAIVEDWIGGGAFG
ncbi:alpha/beta fold hydrolase [Croceicoccus naphthovorans]|uniref:Uncharacterized protein n=1 Tax=Croceicoccus naphthovorans TaxID=1348774 RepID=A0A0G3XF59_9SPHN|nr:alpha/beta hydrolase [Croceicoccus naphthovorans]AKM09842.1 hypothetical protein AB433_07365 [Croceicoccus naphthovorans]MBB3991286.1 pimeloyl-ACP methyl ester carboxylesterase [Croceicoccus naphthovorans]